MLFQRAIGRRHANDLCNTIDGSMNCSDACALPSGNDVGKELNAEFFDANRCASPQIRITPCDAPSCCVTTVCVATSEATACLANDYAADVYSGTDCLRRRAVSSNAIHKSGSESQWSRPPPGGRIRIPRDPTQPTHGSISDVHSDTSADEEDTDHFETFQRPRSRTCPEQIMRRRRSRMRARDRPPTPPPSFASGNAHEMRLSVSPTHRKHSGSYRSLPELPEFGPEPIDADRWNSAEDIIVNRSGTPEEDEWSVRKVDEWMNSLHVSGTGTENAVENDMK